MKLLNMLFLALIFATTADAQTINGLPFIAVQGHAEREVVPDVFPIQITLSETSMDTTKTQEKIEGLATTALELAKKSNLADKEISIGNLDIEPEYYSDKNDNDVFKGNSYSRKIDLRFRTLRDMKAFIRDFPSGKEIKISTQAFSYSKAREIREELLKRAVDNAKADADVLAQSVGRKIIGIQNISNSSAVAMSSNYSNINSIDVFGSRIRRNQSSEITLAEGVTTIQQDVYVIYLLGQ